MVNLVAQYLGNQIMKGNLEYDAVVARFPQYKEEIDEWLAKHHWEKGE